MNLVPSTCRRWLRPQAEPTDSTRRRPRVVILTAYYAPVIGGVETHARAIARYLHAHGQAAAIVTKRISRDQPAVELVDGVPVYRIRPLGPRHGRAKWIMLPFAFTTLLALRRSFDLIYCPDLRGIGLAALAAGRLLRRPVVLESGAPGVLSGTHWNPALVRLGLNPEGRLVRGFRAAVHGWYLKADALVCGTQEIVSEALAAGVDGQRVHHIPSGVDTARFRPPTAPEKRLLRRHEGWPDDQVICVALGRLSVEKGTLDLLEAWRRFQPSKARLVLVGPDMAGHPLDAGARARAWVREHHLDGSVQFYGPTSDPARVLAAADVAVFASHYEAACLAALEAMATGLPLVVTRVGGLAEAVVHGVSGLVCPPRDPAALAAALQRLVADPDLRRVLGARAREAAVERFDAVTQYERYRVVFAAVWARR